MRQPANMCAIRNTVVRNVGRKVMVKCNLGRNKFDIEEGIICDTYPSVFLVQIKDVYNDCYRLKSFSYKDVLTKEVELELCEE